MDIHIINNGVDCAVECLEMLEELLVSGIDIDKQQIANSVSSGVLWIFPEIVDSYELPLLIEYKGQVEYWVTQMDRVVKALEGDDRFLLIDVLIKETKENLLEYQKLIKGLFDVGEE